MDIKFVNIEDITPYKTNPKIHTEEQIKAVAKSIKDFGWLQPLVLSDNNEIVIGHCRYLAAQRMELSAVPCYYACDMTDAQIKAARLADNKTNESLWDIDLLKEELESESLFNINMEDYGFIDNIFSGYPEELNGVDPTPDEMPDYDSEPATLYLNVIITYKDDQKGALEELLGINITKKIIRIEELINAKK